MGHCYSRKMLERNEIGTMCHDNNGKISEIEEWKGR